MVYSADWSSLDDGSRPAFTVPGPGGEDLKVRAERWTIQSLDFLELSIAETAQLLQISEGSVKTHAHRGLQALEKRIEVAR